LSYIGSADGVCPGIGVHDTQAAVVLKSLAREKLFHALRESASDFVVCSEAISTSRFPDTVPKRAHNITLFPIVIIGYVCLLLSNQRKGVILPDVG
jgi:hypothetical protein